MWKPPSKFYCCHTIFNLGQWAKKLFKEFREVFGQILDISKFHSDQLEVFTWEKKYNFKFYRLKQKTSCQKFELIEKRSLCQVCPQLFWDFPEVAVGCRSKASTHIITVWFNLISFWFIYLHNVSLKNCFTVCMKSRQLKSIL